jgi:hypothetical protein
VIRASTCAIRSSSRFRPCEQKKKGRSMMPMTMQVHMLAETKRRILYTMIAGDCSLAPPALLCISAPVRTQQMTMSKMQQATAWLVSCAFRIGHYGLGGWGRGGKGGVGGVVGGCWSTGVGDISRDVSI